MRPYDLVRVQVLYVGGERHVGLVTSSEHPHIPPGAAAFTSPAGAPDVLIPVLLSSGGRTYRADYSPLRAGEDERQRMYFIRHQFRSWFPVPDAALPAGSAVA